MFAHRSNSAATTMSIHQKRAGSSGPAPHYGANSPKRPDLRTQLDHLGWSPSDFVRRIGAHRNTVSRWLNGKAQINGAAKAYIELAVRVRSLLEP